MSVARSLIRDKRFGYDTAELISQVKEIAYPLEDVSDLDPLLDYIGEARYVLLGEASHGTSEYYTWRARLSQRLIQEKDFSFIAVEGDWPDCYQVNRYIKGYEGASSSAYDVLHAFKRWPTWMWANWEIVALTEWLRSYNNGRASAKQVGFYGLDVYSLRNSWRESQRLQSLDESLICAKMLGYFNNVIVGGCQRENDPIVQPRWRKTVKVQVVCPVSSEIPSATTRLHNRGRRFWQT